MTVVEDALRVAWRAFLNTLALMAVAVILSRADYQPLTFIEQVRAYTRWQEFNYEDWMLDALLLKGQMAGLSAPRYLNILEQRQVVFDYLDLVGRIQRLSSEIALIYADPQVKDPQSASADLNRQLLEARAEEARLAPLAEAVIQSQVSAVLTEMGISTLGQPIPPVLYHVTPLPYALIVSPRDRILQEANISLLPGLRLEQRVAIEDAVAQGLNRSTLVVGIGGVGVYPTMVMSTTDLNWLVEVVAHEWTHNYLTLRPLGIRYDASPEMRTINETTASLAGKEIGRRVIERFYPERLPPPPPPPAPPSDGQAPEPQAFNFNREMRITRLKVDELLAEGKIEEAEAYMEARRQFFWEHGYAIRKLNQAYFAFYGAYNDEPGGTGAAGQDPVGPAVRKLREQSPSLAAFLRQIAQVRSFEDLQKMLSAPR